ncbi:hypothetical protein ExPCM15_00938 [Escherichia coli]|nr:hypothetical protein ExPCM15_00938 [Escherichia coli]GCM34032.1 hypothetical protein ExPCM16_02328 [Escherichia coli]GDW68739.1 hypothetical protein ExPUPEC121_04569 [Escherichia coli]
MVIQHIESATVNRLTDRDIVVVVPAQAAVMTDIDCCFGRAIEIYKITLRHRLIKASHTVDREFLTAGKH